MTPEVGRGGRVLGQRRTKRLGFYLEIHLVRICLSPQFENDTIQELPFHSGKDA